MRCGMYARALLVAVIGTVAVAPGAKPQSPSASPSDLPDAPIPAQTSAPARSVSGYSPRAESAALHKYFYQAFGPYPLIISAVVAGYHQARHNPPDWREGLPGYGERYASDFGTSAINVSTRYALAEATDEDVYYYRCTCTGAWPRLRHSVASVVVAHNRITGRQVFALPAVVAPYAGPLVATALWFPRRYGAKDAFRMGNYGLLDYTLSNISLEFLPSLMRGKGKSVMRRLHLENRIWGATARSMP